MLKDSASAALWLLAGITASTVFVTNSWHRLHPLSYRDHFNINLQPYDVTLERLDEQRRQLTDLEFVTMATQAYLDTSTYQWPETLTRISASDNWILWLAAYIDPAMHMLGIQDPENKVFSRFESYRYERAMGRGFGICSQQALGLSDLMTRRYGIPARMLGLGGHVVTELTLTDLGPVIADPSVGIVLPFGYEAINHNLARIEIAYEAVSRSDLAATYDVRDNYLATDTGAHAYSQPAFRQELVRLFELVSDYLSILISLAMAYFAFYRFSRHVRNTH